MNLETIDWIIIATLFVLALIAFSGYSQSGDVLEHLSPTATSLYDKMVDEQIRNQQRKLRDIKLRLDALKNSERNWKFIVDKFGTPAAKGNLAKVRAEIKRYEANKKMIKKMITDRINAYKEIRNYRVKSKQDIQNLENKVKSLTTENESLEEKLNSARATAKSLTNQDADDLVEMAVIKLTEEVMERVDGMNAEQVAVRVGDIVERQIKEYGQQYQKIDKDVLAQKLAEQAGKMFDDIMNDIEAEITDLNDPTPMSQPRPAIEAPSPGINIKKAIKMSKFNPNINFSSPF